MGKQGNWPGMMMDLLGLGRAGSKYRKEEDRGIGEK